MVLALVIRVVVMLIGQEVQGYFQDSVILYLVKHLGLGAVKFMVGSEMVVGLWVVDFGLSYN